MDVGARGYVYGGGPPRLYVRSGGGMCGCGWPVEACLCRGASSDRYYFDWQKFRGGGAQFTAGVLRKASQSGDHERSEMCSHLCPSQCFISGLASWQYYRRLGAPRSGVGRECMAYNIYRHKPPKHATYRGIYLLWIRFICF